MLRLISIFLTVFLVSAVADQRVSFPPFCNNAYELLTPGDTRRIQIEDAQTRELFIMQALGSEGLQVIQNAIKLPPFHKVQTEGEALAIVELMASDPMAFKPVTKLLNDMPPGKAWALYLNSGFHAVSTYTDGHREMVQGAIENFPGKDQRGKNTRVADVGIGNGNLVVAAAIRNPYQITYGVDVASAGQNISNIRLNWISDLNAQKNEDPWVTETGRFWLGKGNATDKNIFGNQKFDAASMVLTLFAVPSAQRKAALQNIYDHLEPGAKFVLIDPLPELNDPEVGKKFLREIVKSAYRNNEELTALDLAILTAKNAHNLLKTDFMTPEQQEALGQSVGFRVAVPSAPAYYGIANMVVFEKPQETLSPGRLVIPVR